MPSINYRKLHFLPYSNTAAGQPEGRASPVMQQLPVLLGSAVTAVCLLSCVVAWEGALQPPPTLCYRVQVRKTRGERTSVSAIRKKRNKKHRGKAGLQSLQSVNNEHKTGYKVLGPYVTLNHFNSCEDANAMWEVSNTGI